MEKYMDYKGILIYHNLLNIPQYIEMMYCANLINLKNNNTINKYNIIN